MRKLFLNGKEYQLKSGDILVLEFNKINLMKFLAVDSVGKTQKLTFIPYGDDKAIIDMGIVVPQAFANFIAELIGFGLAVERQRTSDKIYFYLQK